MKKHEKGILGLKKDPKKQILFSFGARQGDEWPSDDSDSDYEPGEQFEGEFKRDRKRQRDNVNHDKKKRKKVSKAYDESSNKDTLSSHKHTFKSDIWGQKLPCEILSIIFQHVIDQNGTLPFLCRASHVCKLWRNVAVQTSLWQSVDLSYGWIKQKEPVLKWLCEHRFSNVRHLNLSAWKCLTNELLKDVADSCPQLNSINLSRCGKIGFEGIKAVVDTCTQLSDIDLSSMNSKAVSAQCLCYIAEKCADNLKSLNVSGNQLISFPSVLTKICENCPNMEIIEMDNCTFSTDFLALNIEKLQSGCPKLKILRMVNAKVMSRSVSQKEKELSEGFPELAELSVAVSQGGGNAALGIDDQFLRRLLKNSRKLKLLDLRGVSHVSPSGLHGLPINDLNSLFISQSSIAKHGSIDTIMQKWKHSLQELDMSWNVYPGASLDLAMRELSNDSTHSKLEILNLSGTSICCGRIKDILKGCPKLRSINLVSCRGLPRGMKKEYTGKTMESLRKDIDSIKEET